MGGAKDLHEKEKKRTAASQFHNVPIKWPSNFETEHLQLQSCMSPGNRELHKHRDVSEN